jgi:phage gpG-like protein
LNSLGTIGNKFVKKKHSNFSQTANIQAYTIEIPARPFLGLSKQDRQDALDVIRNFLIQP